VRLPLGAAAWVVALLAEHLRRPALMVVPGEADAQVILEMLAILGRPRAAAFPAPSLTPYQEAEVSLSVKAHEAVTLDALARGAVDLLVTTPRALFRRLPAGAAIRAAARDLETGADHDRERLVAHLLRHGYRRTDLVSEVGELAVRGGIVDVFPPGEDDPLRLDFFGDTLESIRPFDRLTQRSAERRDQARLLPLLPFAAGVEEAAALARELHHRCGEVLGDEGRERLEALTGRGGFPGWEGYLPTLAEARAGLADFLPGALVVAVDPPALTEEASRHGAVLEQDFAVRVRQRRPVLPPEELEHPLAAVERLLATAELAVRDLVVGKVGAAVDFAAAPTDLFQGQLPRFPQEVAAALARGDRVWVVAPEVHRGRLAELLEGRGLTVGRGGVEIVAGELERGFRLPAARLALYGEAQILPRARAARSAAKARYGPFVSGLRDLKVGDFVVHQDHGIGQFVGLSRVEAKPEDGAAPWAAPSTGETRDRSEVMEILYAGGRRLLVPLSRLDLIQKFSGLEGVSPRLDQLGGSSWNRTKARVKKGLRDMADELVKLYAQRQLARAPAMAPDSDLLRQFEAAFLYEETPDQLEAIATIKQDLEQERPMDRLLCGDVGYGKTEVAMRAAFKVVDGGYQVAVLAPTTILADQHFNTFRRRFEGFPVTLDMVSRFRSPAEIKTVRERLSEGKVDVLIGTHRLLSRDLEFKRLGLLIVDEEQRFGVAQKERLKQIKQDVHVLAMSATPVPRTLQMSLSGVRDLSVIETPPKDRMAVETAIVPFSPELIREAIEFELERGGQVYYVYNRVETIERVQVFLRELLPGLRITVGHGQLEEQELARRMHAFERGDFDVLLATTIIENGIDIPRVNTMVVHRADRFGLAQLYQLRGRVGRSDQLAYCYLLVPQDRVLSEPARKRLAAIREFSDLGAGFRIAARDLEIRGAGNLLGAEQSGHIGAVGLETYIKLLEETVRELKGEVVEEEVSTALDLPVPLTIPESYVADTNLRMEIYRKIADGAGSGEDLMLELADRFGPPPPPVLTLLEVAALKRRAEVLRIQAVSLRGATLTLRLRRDARVDVERLVELVARRPGAAFSPSGVLTVHPVPGSEVLAVTRGLLEELAP
jgi:transcription-repair coupling factor (superfamily II helicase)